MSRTFLKKYLVTVSDTYIGEEITRFLVVGDLYEGDNIKIIEKEVEQIAKDYKLQEPDYDIVHMFEDEVIYLPREEKTNE